MGHPSTRWLFGVGLVIVVGVLFVVLLRGTHDTSLGPGEPLSKSLTEATEAKEELPSATSTGANNASAVLVTHTGEDAQDVARDALPVATYTGRIIDPDGNPIEGTTVSWTSLPPIVDATSPAAWDWEQVELSTHWARSGKNGEFSFFALPPEATPSGSVIWASHPDFFAAPILLGPDPRTSEEATVLTLTRSSRMHARAVDEANRSIAAARVVQRGFVPDRATLDRAVSPQERARAVLFRSAQTDAAGIAELHPFPDELLVQATHEQRAAIPWIGAVRPEIVLELRDAFTAEGVVRIDDPGEAEGDLRVSIAAHASGIQRSLATVKVDATHTFGPLLLPILEDVRYSFRVEGGRVVPKTEYRDPPESGARCFVELETTFGNDMWFQLLGESDELLNTGEVTVYWDQGARRESKSTSFHPDYPDHIQVRGVPDGCVRALASAPGYASTYPDSFWLPLDQAVTYQFEMKKGGRVAGRVLANGRPVPEFEIAYWPTANPSRPAQRQFTEREDGSFTIEAAPLGDLTLVATSPGHARSDQVRAEVRADRAAEVVIDLADAATARGRVVDEAGAAVATAEIQLFFNDISLLVLPWGSPQAVNSDGTFELRDWPLGASNFVVSAPGYSARQVAADAIAGEELDLGQITLLARQNIEVRLIASGSIDPTAYAVEGRTEERIPLPRRRFSRDGLTQYESVDAGRRFLFLVHPDGSKQEKETMYYPGRAWVVEFEAGGSSRLVVDVVAEPGTVVPNPAFVLLDFRDGRGASTTRSIKLSPEGRVVMDGVRAGPAVLRVGDGTYSNLDSTMLTVADGEEQHVRLSLGARKTRFRVVDRDGRGVPAVFTQLYDAAGGVFLQVETTDARGECSFLGLPDMPLMVGLSHDGLGAVWGQRVRRADDPDEVVELRFVPDASVEIRLLDGEAAVEGVGCVLQDLVSRITATVVTKSDAGGRIRWTRLGRGPYRLISWQKDYWPLDVEVRAEVDGAPIPIQTRRLGDVRFVIRSEAGLPVAGQAVDLRSVEFGEHVKAWIDPKRARVSPPSAMTDETGTLVFMGIPHGAYRWQIEASGQTLHGMVEVPRASEVVVSIAVP